MSERWCECGHPEGYHDERGCHAPTGINMEYDCSCRRRTCTTCGGRGDCLGIRCPSCQGEGWVPVDDDERLPESNPSEMPQTEKPKCLRPPWHPDCYWPRCKCAEMALAESNPSKRREA